MWCLGCCLELLGLLDPAAALFVPRPCGDEKGNGVVASVEVHLDTHTHTDHIWIHLLVFLRNCAAVTKKCLVIWLHPVYLGQLVTSPGSCHFFCFKAKCTAADVGTSGFLATVWFDSIISNKKTKSSVAFDDQWLWVTTPPLPKPFLPGNPVHAYNRGVVLLRLNQWQAASRDFDLAAPWFSEWNILANPQEG